MIFFFNLKESYVISQFPLVVVDLSSDLIVYVPEQEEQVEEKQLQSTHTSHWPDYIKLWSRSLCANGA